FIPNYAKKAAPIQALTRKSVMFNWDDIVQKRFEEIKNDIRERTLLAFIDYDKNIIMQTDASDNAIGGVLLQEDSEGRIEPITFISKVLSERESRWTTNEKEAYAVKYCIEKCEHYLRGCKFTLHTDHANLLWMSAAKSRKVQRWWTFLAEFEFDIVHIKGSSNVVADALSRVGVCLKLRKLCINTTPLLDKIKECQPLFTESERKAYDLIDGFFVDKHHRRVIPKKARTVMKEAFDLFHSATAGHHGAMMTQFKINEEGITWASIANDIRTWISSCVTCKKIKASPKKSITRFRTQAEEPFHTICVDTMGPFPTSASGYKHILVIVDKFTRWVELKALKTLETAEATSAIMNRVVARFGLPMNIVSDGAKQFSC
ncbi:DDE-type integrase/transposase/recombinase, partial [Aduncisulcus paluster]